MLTATGLLVWYGHVYTMLTATGLLVLVRPAATIRVAVLYSGRWFWPANRPWVENHLQNLIVPNNARVWLISSYDSWCSPSAANLSAPAMHARAERTLLAEVRDAFGTHVADARLVPAAMLFIRLACLSPVALLAMLGWELYQDANAALAVAIGLLGLLAAQVLLALQASTEFFSFSRSAAIIPTRPLS